MKQDFKYKVGDRVSWLNPWLKVRLHCTIESRTYTETANDVIRTYQVLADEPTSLEDDERRYSDLYEKVFTKIKDHDNTI